MRILLISLSLMVFVLNGCNSGGKEKSAKAVVFVSILPQQYFVKSIAGDVFNVEVMMPPGSSPHIYEPTTIQMKKLTQAKAYIHMGHLGFEKIWMDKISSVNKSMKIYNQSEGVNFIEVDEHHGDNHSHAGHNHGVVDPHIWLSPAEVNVQVENIYKYLVALQPDSSAYFKRNLELLQALIAATDKEIQSLFSNTTRKSFMIYHPAMAYFARDYNLTQIPLEFEGKEPSGKYITELLELCKKEEIKTIFIQREFPKERANMLADELGAKIEVIDPLEYNWPVNMLLIANNIKRSLNE